MVLVILPALGFREVGPVYKPVLGFEKLGWLKMLKASALN